MATDAELYAGLWEQYQDLAAGMRAIRETVEQAFGATLPPTATLNDELEIITRTIHVIANRPSPASPADADIKTRTYFAHHIETQNDEGENIVGRG
jgi:hypothetical protein